MTHRAVWKIVDDNTQTFDMFGAHADGKEMKMMEITYAETVMGAFSIAGCLHA